jgi:DNA mismatch repair protein MutS
MILDQVDINSLTPLMKQYAVIKNEHADALLFFQVGDFYELFFDDAKQASSFLGIALTKRGTYKDEPIPLCGVPIHALDHYLHKLVKGGFKVALCDQLEEPKPGAIVRRGVTRVLTPGTLTDARLLDEKTASYLMSFFPGPHSWGILFGELLTARLFGTIIPAQADKALDAELMRFIPDEIVLPHEAAPFRSFFSERGYFTSFISGEQFFDGADEWVARINKNKQPEDQALVAALHNFYGYVRKNQEPALQQFNTVHLYKPEEFLVLDAATVRNLELIKNTHDGRTVNTLFDTVDGAATSMGSRAIKRWLTCPLVDKSAVEQRYDAIDTIKNDVAAMRQLREMLVSVGDLERLVGRIALDRATQADYCTLMRSLSGITSLRSLLRQMSESNLLTMIESHMYDFDAIIALLKAALNDDPSQDIVIKTGFDQELDAMRDLIAHAQSKLLELEVQEQQRTGIGSLKVRYNQVFGYSIEITKANLHLVPSDYIRLQTLVGKERFTIPALQKLEHDVRYAENAIADLEKEVFARIKREVLATLHALRSTSYALSRLDALVGFATVAYDHNYVRPVLHEGRDMSIKQGRHPVVERMLSHRFIPNDTELTEQSSLWILTGPNMGGKSTYLRQVALIAIMAQAGSFVPAESAYMPILDRIFTRIGAGDNLSEGKSTFLVEMEETAAICTQATERSLVILDEVGRGTSTFDGMAIAQAVVEYIVQHVHALCLFATHYHELTLLNDTFPTIVNYHAASSKTKQGVLFLYKIEPGVADGSFGLDVAKLAKLPDPILKRAADLLEGLAKQEKKTFVTPQLKGGSKTILDDQCVDMHMRLAQAETKLTEQSQVLGILEEIDLDELSPRKAFDIIMRIRGTHILEER